MKHRDRSLSAAVIAALLNADHAVVRPKRQVVLRPPPKPPEITAQDRAAIARAEEKRQRRAEKAMRQAGGNAMKKTATAKLRGRLEAAETALQAATETAMLSEAKRVEQDRRVRDFLNDLTDRAVKHFLRREENRARVLRDGARRGWEEIFPPVAMTVAARQDEEAQR